MATDSFNPIGFLSELISQMEEHILAPSRRQELDVALDVFPLLVFANEDRDQLDDQIVVDLDLFLGRRADFRTCP